MRSFGAGAFCRHEVLLDAGDKFFARFADLILLARGGKLNGNLVALPVEFERGEARQHAVQLFGGALGQNHHEFAGVQAHREVGTTNDGTHARGEFTQGLVTGFAAQAFVDQAKTLEIEQNQRERVTHPLGAGDLGGEALLSEAAVVEARQRIDHRPIAEPIELRLFVGELCTEALDEELLADRVDIEENDERDEPENGFGEANLEEGADTLVCGHRGEGHNRGDEQQADKNRIAAQRGVALLDQRELLVNLVLAGMKRGLDKISTQGAHVERRGLAPIRQIKGTDILGQWNFGLRGEV